jgi:hypothetical protein
MTNAFQFSRALAAADHTCPLLLSTDTLKAIVGAALNAPAGHAIAAGQNAAPVTLPADVVLGIVRAALGAGDRGPLDDLDVEWQEDVAS